METPLTDHLTASDYENVYEPAEDTFLLLDALEADLSYIERIDPCVCVELGSGSGVIITAIAKKLKNAMCLAVDINPRACEVTKQTAKRNTTSVDTINGNLLGSLRAHSIDLLIFNPPYVVTTDEELQQQKLDNVNSTTQSNLVYSWAGGECGRRVIDNLLPQLDAALSACGVFYLLVLRENRPDEMILRLNGLGFEAVKFMERRIPGEYLYILKVIRR